MLRIQPTAIIAQNADVYHVVCDTAGGVERYEFNTIYSVEAQSRIVCDVDKRLHFVTYDDPAIYALEHAVLTFDEYRNGRSNRAEQLHEFQPHSIIAEVAEGDTLQRYIIVCANNSLTNEYSAAVNQKNGKRLVEWEYGSMSSTLTANKWKIENPSSCWLLVSILNLHEARHCTYTDTQLLSR